MFKVITVQAILVGLVILTVEALFIALGWPMTCPSTVGWVLVSVFPALGFLITFFGAWLHALMTEAENTGRL